MSSTKHPRTGKVVKGLLIFISLSTLLLQGIPEAVHNLKEVINVLAKDRVRASNGLPNHERGVARVKDLAGAARVLLVVLFVMFSVMVAVADAALASTETDMANLTNTLTALMIAIIPLIVIIGIFAYILAKVKFQGK